MYFTIKNLFPTKIMINNFFLEIVGGIYINDFPQHHTLTVSPKKIIFSVVVLTEELESLLVKVLHTLSNSFVE